MNVEEMLAQQEQQRQIEEQRAMILDQILEPDAMSRLTRLALVKKETARVVEDSLINAAKTGKLAKKVSEVDLIQMLEQLSGGDGPAALAAPKKKVVVQRRKYGIDSDDEDDNDDDFV